VFDTVINYLDKFGPEILVIQFGFLVIISTLFLWLWFFNRRRYHHLKHAIPANVVKNYLDSIIQNSTALKSSLFRGGGMDVGGVPSVMPLSNMIGGESLGINGAPSTALLEELNHKKALISSLEAQLSSFHGSQREVETKLSSSQGQISSAENKIKELEALLARVRNESGGDDTLKAEVGMLTKERNEIRDKLKEFEIISDDLANLKRLQQENEQLKRSLAAVKGVTSVPEMMVNLSPAANEMMDEPINQVSEQTVLNESQLDEFLDSPDSLEAKSIDPAAGLAALDPIEEQPLQNSSVNELESESAPENQNEKSKPDKTPEDLLSEFEKMLG
jgi:predicted nuclease with TOPRIM domain